MTEHPNRFAALISGVGHHGRGHPIRTTEPGRIADSNMTRLSRPKRISTCRRTLAPATSSAKEFLINSTGTSGVSSGNGYGTTCKTNKRISAARSLERRVAISTAFRVLSVLTWSTVTSTGRPAVLSTGAVRSGFDASFFDFAIVLSRLQVLLVILQACY